MPRIYVASLSDYNAGRLHGAWVDLDGKDADDVQAEIRAMLARSADPHAEEWAIHDHEGFGSYKVSEFEDLPDLVTLAELIDSRGEWVPELWSHGVVSRVSDLGAWIDDHYRGAHRSLTDYAADLCADLYDLSKLPALISGHIDWEGIARDLRIGGDVFTIEHAGETHVFDNA